MGIIRSDGLIESNGPSFKFLEERRLHHMLYEKPTLVTLTLAELENADMTAKLQDVIIILPRPAPCHCQCQCQCQCQGQSN